MTRYLTAQQVVFIHAHLIETTGASHGVGDVGLLESAVARPQATFEGRELYDDLFKKTAALFESLILNHPFIEGNKGTAITAAALFIQLNGLKLDVTNDELEQFPLKVVKTRPPLAEIAGWFRENTSQAGAL